MIASFSTLSDKHRMYRRSNLCKQQMLVNAQLHQSKIYAYKYIFRNIFIDILCVIEKNTRIRCFIEPCIVLQMNSFVFDLMQFNSQVCLVNDITIRNYNSFVSYFWIFQSHSKSELPKLRIWVKPFPSWSSTINNSWNKTYHPLAALSIY